METFVSVHRIEYLHFVRISLPRKGTETPYCLILGVNDLVQISLPRKGTETQEKQSEETRKMTRSNLITPQGDGTLLLFLALSAFLLVQISLPRKGTETPIGSDRFVVFLRWFKSHYPARGRKLVQHQ